MDENTPQEETQLEAFLKQLWGDDYATDFKNFMDNAINSAVNVGFCAISVEQPENKIFFRYRSRSETEMNYNFGPYDRIANIMVSYYLDSITFKSVFSSPVVLTWYYTPIQ